MTESMTGTPQIRGTPRILCVHQEAELHGRLRAALATWDVMVVSTAFEALRELNQAPFDAYVTSYWLPDLSGLSLCREIRKVDPHAPICVIAMSDEKSQRARALRAGADAVIGPTDDLGPAVVHALQPLFWNMQDRNDQAMIDENLAIEQELSRQAQRLAEQSTAARELAGAAVERMTRTKAMSAYISAGGTLANFERIWPTVFQSTQQGRS